MDIIHVWVSIRLSWPQQTACQDWRRSKLMGRSSQGCSSGINPWPIIIQHIYKRLVLFNRKMQPLHLRYNYFRFRCHLSRKSYPSCVSIAIMPLISLQSMAQISSKSFFIIITTGSYWITVRRKHNYYVTKLCQSARCHHWQTLDIQWSHQLNSQVDHQK